MKETQLIRLQAERMTTPAIKAELRRIDGALSRADTPPKQARRYERRRDLFSAEITIRQTARSMS